MKQPLIYIPAFLKIKPRRVIDFNPDAYSKNVDTISAELLWGGEGEGSELAITAVFMNNLTPSPHANLFHSAPCRAAHPTPLRGHLSVMAASAPAHSIFLTDAAKNRVGQTEHSRRLQQNSTTLFINDYSYKAFNFKQVLRQESPSYNFRKTL